MAALKSIRVKFPIPHPHWVGNGFRVRPLFHNLAFTNEISPFLMFDYAEPRHFDPTSKQLGVGGHPHRGFETVTIALHGEVEHGDSRGNHGVIKEGDVQWMTAASGVVHQEYHSREFAKRGGQFEMIQLWVNLPQEHKMAEPRYQALLKEDIPEVEVPSGSVRIIAGEFEGTQGAAKTFTPVDLWIARVKAGEEFRFAVKPDHNTMLFVRSGKIEYAGEELPLHQLVLLSKEGTDVVFRAVGEEANVVVLGGQTIDEPIAARGPFVMNTQEELLQAMADFHSGKMGFI